MKNVIVSIENQKEIIETIESVVAEIKDNNAAELEELIKKKTFREKLSKAIGGNKNGQKMILKEITDLGCLLQLLTSLSQQIYMENHKLVEELFACTVVLDNRFVELKTEIQNLKEELIKLKTKRDLNVYNIEKLNADEKMILICIINTIFADAEKTEAMREYHRCVRAFVGGGNDLSDRIQNPEEDMEAIQHTELFYRFILEAIAFVDAELSQETLAKIEEITDQLTMKRSKQKEIFQGVLNDINDLGVEYFCYKYENATNDSIELLYLDDSFFEEDQDNSILELDLQECEDSDFIDVSAGILEEESVLTILTIPKGETKIFKNKSLHINAFVNCSGTLRIENCTLYYNENDFCDEIVLNTDAELTIKGSRIVCCGFDKKHFISCNDAKKIIISDTIFDNCSYFIKGTVEEFSLQESRLNNCYKGFLEIYTLICEISGNAIANHTLKNENCFEGLWDECFDLGGREQKSIHFFNNIIEIDAAFSKEEKPFFQFFNATIEKCTFVGLSQPIYTHGATSVENCKFVSCSNIFHVSSGESSIRNCYFEKCSVIFLADKHLQVENCCFVSCFNDLIISSYFGDIKILSCHFVNLVSNPSEEKRFGVYTKTVTSIFKFKIDKDSKTSYIKNCIFDGVSLNDAYFIKFDGYENSKKTAVVMENCELRNCSSQKNDIIKNEYHYYPTKFSKKLKSAYAEMRKYNCRGFDTISKESLPVDEDKINTIREQYANLGADLQIDE